jgi:hypothetical protein
MIGTIINDRYNIQTEIGRGGMGTVYQGEDILLELPERLLDDRRHLP